MKSGSFNLLEPSGLVEVCAGLLYLYGYRIYFHVLMPIIINVTVFSEKEDQVLSKRRH
jgi:hypothetical protein